jgi:hypothetical protein
MVWFPKKAKHKAKPEDTAKNRAYAAAARQALEGFIAGDEAAARRLIGMLTPLIYAYVDKHYEGWLPLWREVQARCFESLVVWRHKGILRLDEPLPYLRKRLVKQAIRAMESEENQQEAVAESWVAERRPAAPRADQLLDAKRLIERIWKFAKAKLTPGRVEALQAWVLEEEGGAPVEQTLEMDRESAIKQVRRAQAQLLELARAKGLLNEIHWEGRGDLVQNEPQIEDESHD